MADEALRDLGKACTPCDILLVDDTPSWIRLVRETFVPAGYKCDFAEDLNSALSLHFAP
jgi:CheY-like chemotaxis protein